MCAVYSPRDPIAEYWQGRLGLRALHALIVHMPPGNVFYRAVSGDGWTEGEWLTHDVGEMLRELQLTIVNTNPLVERKITEEDIRPRILPPARRRDGSVAEDPDGELRMRERKELMALALGR